MVKVNFSLQTEKTPCFRPTQLVADGHHACHCYAFWSRATLYVTKYCTRHHKIIHIFNSIDKSHQCTFNLCNKCLYMSFQVNEINCSLIAIYLAYHK